MWYATVYYKNSFLFTDVQIEPLRRHDVDKLSYNNSLPSISAINHINDEDKNVINSKKYECNERNIVCDLYTRLTVNGFQEDTPHNKNKNDNNYEMNSKVNRSIESPIDYIDICKNQSMVRVFGDNFYDSDKNSDTAKINLWKNIEFGKKQSENTINKNVVTEIVNGKKSESCSITVSIKCSKTYFNDLFQIKIIRKSNINFWIYLKIKLNWDIK